MLCMICTEMLRDGKGYEFRGTYTPTFAHHKSTAALQQSVLFGCSICMSLARALPHNVDLRNNDPISVNATLDKAVETQSVHSGIRYRLNFYLGKMPLRNFLLDEADPSHRSKLILSNNTSSDEVFSTAQTWMKKCECVKFWEEPGDKWYPRRLLDLQELRTAKGDLEHAKIRLVESEEVLHQGTKASMFHRTGHGNVNDRYVSLSHCWGKPKQGKEPLRFTFETERRYKEKGIELRELPKNFRDAVLFASRLERVGYIWIDSLCIRQPIWGPGVNKQEQLQDWVEQSRHMGTVYKKAFLNISATASSDGDGGLFYPRRPEHLLADEAIVDYSAMDPAGLMKHGSSKQHRCTVINASIWDDLVEQAPINKRGWVFQERLLAPRVLHFCHNQIAWECTEFKKAEGLSDMYSNLGIRNDRVVEEGRLKSLTLSNGRELRETRLRGAPDPDKAMQDLYVFELWKHVVEVYSHTQLTEAKDELIALGGVAQKFQEELFSVNSHCEYVAGLWSKHLQSQLLWYVNELYRDGVFENPAQRPKEKRAPSFSWAAVISPLGITYADVTDYAGVQAYGPFFNVLDYNITYVDPKNPFGMVADGQLLIQPQYLRQIEVLKPSSQSLPYVWRLKHNITTGKVRTHGNMYLDAPDSDAGIFRNDAELYCMPAAFGERTEGVPEHLFCLLLEYEGQVTFATENNKATPAVYRGFRRIGLAKLSNFAASKSQAAVMDKAINEVICLC